MHAIRVNDEEMVKLLLDTKQVKINAVDENGWSAVHHVINPTNFGSYENEAILKILHENGADIDLKDSNGRSPLYYASLQDSKTLFNALMNLGAKSLPKTPLRYVTLEMNIQTFPLHHPHSCYFISFREQSAILDWADTGINYELDAEEFIKTKERIVKEDTPIKVDRYDILY
jgi:ankyrin repeat protein